MIEDVYEPLARYRDEFREKFARLAEEKFDELTERSQVDVQANRGLVSEIGRLERSASGERAKKTLYGCLMALGFAGAAVASVAAYARNGAGGRSGTLFACAAAGVALGCAMIPLFRAASRRLANLRREIESKRDAAWEQMEPLNGLYTWDIPLRLIEATVPRLDFDPYFTADRLSALRSRFGWDDSFNDGKSVVFAQSGVINGNPFVFGQCLCMEWGTETYVGTKQISWTVWETDASGRRRPVRRYETLRAEVTKPKPVYGERKVLIYGNDAAPGLSFSREPSGLTGKDGSVLASLKKKWRLGRLKAYSRNLDDDSAFTLMNNEEFETWFHAKDRDNEVEFRLLFTPVAQTQMLALMKDAEVGYGDDFSFAKARKVNVLTSRHLDEGEIDTNPARFRNWDYDAARRFFVKFNEKYFKDAYFALAPLLAIPLYQQTRTHEEIWKDVVGRREASFWEHEATANYRGEEHFRHPGSITRNILKTQVASRGNGECVVSVTAHGFKGEKRVECKSVYGGDGKWHSVPVEWTEYIPVQRTREMAVGVNGGEMLRKGLYSTLRA